jgi:Zn-dependent peptidase ImmA (M78 family)/transcriptional regulator with XRE-family HTH domain
MDKLFNGSLLTLARQIRRKGQAELVTLLDGCIAQGTLSKLEHGRIQPQPDLVVKLADALRVRPSFFYQSAYVREPMVSYHRKRAKLAVKDQDAVHGLAEVFRLNLKALLASVELEPSLPSLPAIDPDEYGRDIEEIARVLRQRWQLPKGPVEDLTRLAERAGIIIFAFDFGTELMDGFCQHACDGLPPIIYINANQPKDRYRFSLAHEIGHLVCHQTPYPEQELEANRFAAEFLMPTRDIKNDFEPHSLTRFMDLKLYWGTSMQSLIYKAWQIGSLSDRMHKYYVIEMSKRGFRKREPVEATHLIETPTTLRSIIQSHITELGYTIEELSDLFGLVAEDVEALYPVPAERPRLRLVS